MGDQRDKSLFSPHCVRLLRSGAKRAQKVSARAEGERKRSDMAITTFIEPKRRQQYLILLLIVVVLGILFLIWNYFLSKPLPPISPPVPPSEIKINFEILKSPLLEELEPFEKIPPFEKTIGRENPFIPY